MDFASENSSPVHPAVVDAVVKANDGFALNFEQEAWTARAIATLKEVFEHDLVAFPVLTGTAANAVALGAMVRPWQSILCHWDAHIETDEGGAPEMFTAGARQIGVAGEHGKISPQALRRRLEATRFGVVHELQPKVLSLTQQTEAGTAYTPDEIRELASIAKNRDLLVHMDGARFANAVAKAGCTAAQMTWQAGVDVLCLGTTKSGTFGAEVVIAFDPSLAESISFMRKRGGHFAPKSRFIAAQIEAYFEDDLWLKNARHANACAAALAEGLKSVAGAELVHSVDGNQVFVSLPEEIVERLVAHGVKFHRDWRIDPRQHRFVCSWASRKSDISAVIEIARGPA